MAAGEMLAGTILGKLLLDTKGWKSAIEGVKSDEDKLNKSALGIGDSFKKTGTAMAAAGTLIVGSLMAIVYKTAQARDNMGELAQKIGVNVETLSWMKYAGDKAGVSIESMAVGLGLLSKKMVDAISGGKQSAQVFNLLGIEVKNSSGEMKSSEEIMFEVADRFAKMDDGATKTALAMELFGRSGKEMVPILSLGADGLRAERDRAAELGLVLSKDAVKASSDFMDSTIDMKAALGSAGREIAEALLPVITGLAKGIAGVASSIGTWMREHKGLVTALGEWILKIGGILLVLGSLMKVIQLVDKAIGFFGNTLKFLAANPMVLVIAGVVALALALDSLTRAFIKNQDAQIDAIKKGSEPMAQSMELRKKMIKDEIITWEEWKTALNSFGNNYQKFISEVLTSNDPKWAKYKKALEEIRKAHEDQKKPIGDMTAEIQNLMNSIGKAEAAQKSWIEFLQNQGIKTLDEKKKRIKELQEYLKDLTTETGRAELSSSDWEKAVKAANEEIEELSDQLPGATAKILSFDDAVDDSGTSLDFWEKMLNEAGKTADVGTDAFDKAKKSVESFTGATEDSAAGTKEALTETINYWQNFVSNLQSGFSNLLKTWASGTMTFKDLMKGLWDTIKSAFFDMVAQIISRWAVAWLSNIVPTAAAGAASVSATMTGLGGVVAGIATTIAGIITTLATAVSGAIAILATGIATALVTLATAIAAAATILAAAAAAIITVGALAIALYTAFSLVGGIIDAIIGGGGGNSDITYWLKLIKDNSQVTADVLHVTLTPLIDDIAQGVTALIMPIQDGYNKLVQQIDMLAQINSVLHSMDDSLKSIDGNTEGGAQEGAKISEPTWLQTGEEAPRIPEYILPEPHLMNLLKAARSAGSGGGETSIAINGQKINFRKGLKKILIDLIPELTADGFLKVNVRALAAER